MEAPTIKQRYRIRQIEQDLGIRFYGRTKQSAMKFIGRFKAISQNIDNLDNNFAWKQLSKKKSVLEYNQ